MENKKCLHCGKDLTEADILQFNEFCSVRCYHAYKKCLHCGKDLTEADILHFNKFCCVAHQEEYIVEFIKRWTQDPAHMKSLEYLRDNIDLFNFTKDIQQIKANIITLDKQAHEEAKSINSNPKLYASSKHPAIALVCKGRKFVRYRIGDSEIRTAPSKFTGYVANNVAFHSLMKNWPDRHRDERIGKDWRDGRLTNPLIDTIFIKYSRFVNLSLKEYLENLESHKEARQRYSEQLEEHYSYCHSLGGTPSNHQYGVVRFFNPDEPLIISP